MADDTIDTIQHEPQAETASPRRVLTETETLEPCRGDGGEDDCLPSLPNAFCSQCHGTGYYWRVTSRTVQVGHSFEEQAAYAIIKGLHEHIRKAAATVDQAATFLETAGQSKQAKGMRAAAQAILQPVEGQD